jgi:hypothetical protein
MEMPQESYFWLKNGAAIKSIDELSKALKTMPDDVFNHHVNSEKNDFANWICDVLKDKKLAQKISSAKSTEEMINHINIEVSPRSKKEDAVLVKNKKAFLEKDKDVESMISDGKLKKKKAGKVAKKTAENKSKDSDNRSKKNLNMSKDKKTMLISACRSSRLCKKDYVNQKKEQAHPCSLCTAIIPRLKSAYKKVLPYITSKAGINNKYIICGVSCPHKRFIGVFPVFIWGFCMGILLAAILFVRCIRW